METVSARMISSASPPLRSRSSSLASHASTGKAKRKSTSLPSKTVEYLKNWMMSPAHIAHPYPTEQEKAQIMKDTGIELKQLTNWFVNNRKRYWKPRVEKRLHEQAKASSSAPETSKVSSTDSSTSSSVAPAASPSRRHSLVHIISTPNVSALVEQAAVEEQQRASPLVSEAAPVTPSVEAKSIAYHQQVPSEVSCTLSENDESVGMNLDTDEMSTGQATREDEQQPSVCKEVVDVHVLAASSGTSPSDKDVLVGPLPSGSQSLHTFAKCDLIYTVFSSRKNETDRDIQVERLKSHYFSVFSEELRPKGKGKRKVSHARDEPLAHRPKYRRVSIETWKKACEDAHDGYCDSLPTIEEAARLFGFRN